MKLKTGKCIIISAPSGAGKSTIVKFLLSRFSNLSFSISATSRARRNYETHGMHYYFITAKEFREKIKAEEFLEWEEVYKNHYYGTLKSEMTRIWGEKKNVIFDVDVEGGRNLKAYFGNRALAIFVQPPSVEILEQRLRDRSTETEETLLTRISKAEHELTYANQFDKTIVNDDLDKACAEAYNVVKDFLES